MITEPLAPPLLSFSYICEECGRANKILISQAGDTQRFACPDCNTYQNLATRPCGVCKGHNIVKSNQSFSCARCHGVTGWDERWRLIPPTVPKKSFMLALFQRFLKPKKSVLAWDRSKNCPSCGQQSVYFEIGDGCILWCILCNKDITDVYRTVSDITGRKG